MQEFKSVYWEMEGGILFNGNAPEESESIGEECDSYATEVWWRQGFYITKLSRHVQIWTDWPVFLLLDHILKRWNANMFVRFGKY